MDNDLIYTRNSVKECILLFFRTHDYFLCKDGKYRPKGKAYPPEEIEEYVDMVDGGCPRPMRHLFDKPVSDVRISRSECIDMIRSMIENI